MIIPICKESGRPCELPHNQPCGKCDRCEAMGYTNYPQTERQPFNHEQYLKQQAKKSIVEQ